MSLCTSQLNLLGNELCGLDEYGDGTYTTEGITALANALKVTGSLTDVDVRHNHITGDGASQLSTAVLGNTTIEIFNEIPIKEMRTDSFTTLDLKKKYIGVEGGMVVAGLLPAMASVTVTDMRYNELDTESATMLANVAKEKRISLCGIAPEQTEADFTPSKNDDKRMGPADGILLTADLAVRTSSLTKILVQGNELGDEGGKLLREAVQGREDFELEL